MRLGTEENRGFGKGLILTHRGVNKSRQDLFGGEDLLSDTARRLAMAGIVAVDLFHAPRGLRQVLKSDDAFPEWQPVAQTSIFDQDGPPGRQITHAPVAEPSTAHFHVAV